ncbi:MAG: hypothetical protein AAF657_01145 [Acidobacteriota bacterium]
MAKIFVNMREPEKDHLLVGYGTLLYRASLGDTLGSAEVRQIDNPRGLAGVLGMYAALLGYLPERRPEAISQAEEAVELMKEHRLEQAFGGRTLDEMQALRDELSSAPPWITTSRKRRARSHPDNATIGSTGRP